MSFQVFISYSSKDRHVGDAVCATLEQRGLRCWIAPRNIVPGSEWGEAIMDGLTSCQVFVLVFSGNANQSPQVRRELERAVHHGLVVIPFRIEDVVPAKAMEYFMSVPHWLDAMTPPLEQHLDKLAEVAGRVLSDPGAALDDNTPARARIDPRVALASLAVLAALPAAAAIAQFDPPWPGGIGYASVALVAAGAAWPHFAPGHARWLAGKWLRWLLGGLVIVAVAYLSLQSMFIETIPGTGLRVVKGFVCTPDAELVFGDSCPGLGRDALRDAEWEAASLWTGPSLMAVRVALVAAWLAFVAGLGLIAARIERLRLTTRQRKAG